MNDVIRYVLTPKLSYKDVVNLSLVNKRYNRLLNKILTDYKIKLDEIYETLPSFIFDMISLDQWIESEKIDFDQKWIGSTGYIDRFKYNDVNKTLGYGKDTWGRSFLTVKMLSTDLNTGHNRNGIVCIFQRYSDDKNKYTYGGGDRFIDPLFYSGGIFSQECLNRLKRLFSTKELVYEFDTDIDTTVRYKYILK